MPVAFTLLCRPSCRCAHPFFPNCPPTFLTPRHIPLFMGVCMCAYCFVCTCVRVFLCREAIENAALHPWCSHEGHVAITAIACCVILQYCDLQHCIRHCGMIVPCIIVAVLCLVMLHHCGMIVPCNITIILHDCSLYHCITEA